MKISQFTMILLSSLTLAGMQASAEEAKPQPKPARAMHADTNQDGKVSFEEFKAAGEKRMEMQFKRMDSNGDGFIDEAERTAMHDKMRDMREMHKKHEMGDMAEPAPAK